MSEASRFWSNQEREYSYGSEWVLIRESALDWLKKDRWTVWEGACLLSGFDPETCRCAFFNLDVGKAIYEKIVDVTPNVVGGKTNKEAEKLASLSKVRFYQLGDSVAKYTGQECNLFNIASSLSFPVKAFLQFGFWEYFPNTKSGKDLPCFGIFHDLEAETKAVSCDRLITKTEKIEPDFKRALDLLGWFTDEKDAYSEYQSELIQDAEKNLSAMAEEIGEQAPITEQIEQDGEEVAPWDEPLEQDASETDSAKASKGLLSEAPSSQVIVNGLTVADVRAMLDKSNPRYRPELHAALCVWTSFEHSPVPEGFTPKNEVGIRLADWENDHQMDLLESERKRIRVMVNWDKEGNKQRPKTK